MKELINGIKIEELYRYNLIKPIEIAKYLDVWDNLSEEEKLDFEEQSKPLLKRKFDLPDNLTKEDLIEIVTRPDFDEQYQDNLVYGEVLKRGVYELSSFLKDYTGNFYDIGSGNGKLIFQISLLNTFNKYVGIEISKIRHLYAEKIKKDLSIENVELILGDVLQIDISDANVVFIDDLMFSKSLREDIVNYLPTGCYFFSTYQHDQEFIEKIDLEVSWQSFMTFNLYLKK